MKGVAFLTIGAIAVGTALISVQNAAPISIRFLAWRSIDLPLGLVLSIGFALGTILSVIFPAIWRLGVVYDDLDEAAFADSSGFNKDSSDDWDT
ncbi:LapA family protein [Altericista sp. CCNU0014]|uniref:LapA family protein n=1 Tax=Altericista sp. CCNU0014 TaxID=3082949 RepID=UPI00384CD8EB